MVPVMSLSGRQAGVYVYVLSPRHADHRWCVARCGIPPAGRHAARVGGEQNMFAGGGATVGLRWAGSGVRGNVNFRFTREESTFV